MQPTSRRIRSRSRRGSSRAAKARAAYDLWRTVRIRNLGRLASVIDAAVRAGATEVDGPSFSRSNEGELYRGALASALTDARLKAQAIATAAGATVGSVIEVREGSDTGGAAPIAAAGAPSGPSIEPGTLEIDATVTVTFAAG